jgi:hypothetical protein
VTQDRDKCRQDLDALKDTDKSTPSTSVVSLNSPENSSAPRHEAVVAGPSRQRGPLPLVADEESANRPGSPAEAVGGSHDRLPLTRKASRSSSRRSQHSLKGKRLVKSSSRIESCKGIALGHGRVTEVTETRTSVYK